MNVHPLQAYREANQLSRRELAEALDVDRITVWRWENRVRIPDRRLLAKIARLTGVSVADLMEIGDAE